MEKLYTENRSSDYNFKIELAYKERDSFDPAVGQGSHFRLCLFENSGGLLKFDGYTLPIRGSCCLCLNEQEAPEVIIDEKSIVHTIYFKPSTVNGGFTLKNIRGDKKSCPKAPFSTATT